MAKGVIIHLDNDVKNVLEPAKNLFPQLDIDLDYVPCENKDEFMLNLGKYHSSIKALIFDLLSQEPSAEEISDENAHFLNNIEKSFTDYSIPIFIYSGYLDLLEDKYNENGTVFKIDKENSTLVIFQKIKELYESGFIDVFCPGGVLDTEIKEEIHKSFTKQFQKNSQIEDVLFSIKSASAEERKKRVKGIFKRISIKALATDLLTPVAANGDKVHPIEHFYKRQSELRVWTGDIWSKKDTKQNVLILTPRCDIASGKFKTLILSNINEAPEIKLTGKKEDIDKRVRNYLTDNISGKSQRYIHCNAFFPKGGMVKLEEHFTIGIKEFLDNYSYIVTLSDELTNEIIGKFAYYFLRTGISTVNEEELENILEAISLKDKE